jgi:hypothetical protein
VASTDPSFQEANAIALADVAQLAGIGVEDVFLYSEHMTPTQGRWFFQSWVEGIPGVTRVCRSQLKATANLAVILAWCRANPEGARALTERYRQ